MTLPCRKLIISVIVESQINTLDTLVNREEIWTPGLICCNDTSFTTVIN